MDYGSIAPVLAFIEVFKRNGVEIDVVSILAVLQRYGFAKRSWHYLEGLIAASGYDIGRSGRLPCRGCDPAPQKSQLITITHLAFD